MSNFTTKNPVVVIVGPTCSGKTTLKKMMINAGFTGIKTWTSRKKRNGESDADYEFVSKTVMEACYKEGMFAEMTEYDSKLYGSVKKDYTISSGGKPKVIVLNPRGARRVLERLSDVPFIFVYLNPHPDVLANRAVRRDLDGTEFRRRMDTDGPELLEFYEDFFGDVDPEKIVGSIPNCPGTYYAKEPFSKHKNLAGVVASSWHLLDQDFANWLWRFAVMTSFDNV